MVVFCMQLSEWTASPFLTVDFGEYSIDNTIGLKSTEEQLRYLREEVSNLAFFPVLNTNTEILLAIPGTLQFGRFLHKK